MIGAFVVAAVPVVVPAPVMVPVVVPAPVPAAVPAAVGPSVVDDLEAPGRGVVAAVTAHVDLVPSGGGGRFDLDVATQRHGEVGVPGGLGLVLVVLLAERAAREIGVRDEGPGLGDGRVPLAPLDLDLDLTPG